MKILTLNTHSLQETDYHLKLNCFIDTVIREKPDVVALQEVNQTMSAPVIPPEQLEGMVPAPENSIPVRWDNHAAAVALALHKAGLSCSWIWLSIKEGYRSYDEGVALFSLDRKIAETDSFYISTTRQYHNWKSRKVLGVRLEGRDDWFYTVHMGWWSDEEEPFLMQLGRLDTRLSDKKAQGPVWLLGDFNSPAEVRGEGYDCIAGLGWQDTYLLAREKDSGITVEGAIDGWRDKLDDPSSVTGMRIDHIWCSRPVSVLRSTVRFNGKKDLQVSDHYGVLIETMEDAKSREEDLT